MLKYFLIVGLLLYSVSIYAQKSRFRYGTSLSLNATNTEYLPLSPSFTYSSDKHFFGIGPKLPLRYDNFGHRFGLDFMYKCYPNPANRVLNFYFVSYTEFVRTKYHYYYINNTTNDVNASISSQLGYGFEVRLKDHFYLSHHIGMGALYSNDFYWDFNFMIHLGVGYRFGKSE